MKITVRKSQKESVTWGVYGQLWSPYSNGHFPKEKLKKIHGFSWFVWSRTILESQHYPKKLNLTAKNTMTRQYCTKVPLCDINRMKLVNCGVQSYASFSNITLLNLIIKFPIRPVVVIQLIFKFLQAFKNNFYHFMIHVFEPQAYLYFLPMFLMIEYWFISSMHLNYTIKYMYILCIIQCWLLSTGRVSLYPQYKQ